MSWRGRRVTDPKPVVRAPLDEYGINPTPGLDPVYKGVESAKSQLRHMEHRLTEAERTNAATSGLPDNLSVAVDRVPSFTVNPNAKPFSVLVDSMGKTQYLRSREEKSRKVSRLEEKYKDKSVEDILRSKRHDPSDRKVMWMEDTAGASSTTTTTGYKSATGSSLRGLSSLDTRTVDPSSTHHASSSTYNPHRTDSGNRYNEASVHFLNDEHEVLTRDGGVRGYMDLPGRWTKVDVNVPSGSSGVAMGKGRRTERADPFASTYPPKSANAEFDAPETNTGAKASALSLKSSGSSTASAPANVNATYTVNGSSSNDSLHFKPKKSLKDLERSSDTLAKLREKVRQQKMASSGESQGSSDDLHVKHKPEDVVIPHGLTAPHGHTAQAIVRKVAAGPPVPRYQGFSETEMKYSLPDGKMVKVSDIRRRKMKKLRKEAPLREKNASQNADSQDKKPPKATRVIAAAKKPSKGDRQSDIITARSWRVGAQLVLRELGPNKVTIHEQDSSTYDKSESGSVAPRKDPAAPISSDARAVLNDMESDEEHEKASSKPQRPVMKRSKPPPDDDLEDAKKQRHYNIDEVKQYIIKQKAERKKQQVQESERQRQSREQRQAQLAELYRRQREVASKPIILPADHNSDINRTLTLDGPSNQRQDDEAQKASGESDKENRGGVNSVGAWGDVSSADSTLSGESGEAGPGAAPRRDVLRKLTGDAQYFINKYATRSPEIGDIISKYSTSARADGQDLRMPDEAEQSKPDTERTRAAAAAAGSFTSKYTSGAMGPTAAGLRSADSGLGTTAPDISKYLKESGINVDQIVTQYAKRAADIGINYNPPSRPISSGASSLPSRFKDDPLMTLPNQPLSSTATIGARQRADRIRALCDNASRLGNRLDTERQRIAGLPQAASSGKWAYSREDLDAPEFRSRYDRMAGNMDSHKIFDSDIPGVGSLYKSRKTGMMDERRPQSSSSTRDYQHLKESDLSDLSDSTLHEDDLYKPFALNKPAAKIRLPSTSVKHQAELGRLRPTTATRWDDPKGDPYSVMNILSRRKDQVSYNSYKRVGMFNDVDMEDMQSDADLTLKTDSEHQVSDQLSVSEDSTFTEEPSAPAKVSRHSLASASHRSASPVSVSQLSGSEAESSLGEYTKSFNNEALSHRSISHRSARNEGTIDAALSHRSAISHRSNHSVSQHSRAVSGHRSAKKTTYDGDDNKGYKSESVHEEEEMEVGDDDDDDDDTLEEHPISSNTSELDDKYGNETPRDVEISDVSESSDLSVHDRSTGNRRAYAPGGILYRSSAVSGRLSPGALERRMTAELNLLESMEESVRQLADVDRSRGVSLAQQETVSLAQVLKAQEQSHKLQTAAFQKDSNLMSREVIRAQQIAADAAESSAKSIEKARIDTTRSLQDSTVNLIAAQSEATKATAEAARQLAEVKIAASGASAAMNDENASRLIKDTAVATATAVAQALADTRGLKRPSKYDDHSTQYSRRSATPAGGDSSVSDSYETDFTRESTSYRTRSKGASQSRPDSRTSYTMDVDTASPGTGTASVKTGSIATATDLSRNTVSSIATEPGLTAAGSQDNSKSESILEEVMSEKLNDDYSIEFDTSITEEEMEKSLREVIPAEDHRKKVKKTSSQSDISSVASDDHPASGTLTPSRRLSFEGDSFTKFTMDMVRQYMREEEIRAQHQAALLKLRERALKEKTQAELAWLEQQKHKVRDKGADESFPLLKKKKRGLLMRLQQEQAEIRRLKEASKAASKERQFLLLQSQEIARLRQSTQEILRKTHHGHSKVEDWLNDLDSSSLELDSHSALAQVKNKIKESGVDLETDEAVKMDLDESDAFSLASPTKGDNDSELGDKKQDLKALQKLRKMKLDDKFLTHREQQLLQRRLNVEGLLEWKNKLDQEEAEIEAMEKQALALTRRKEKEARERASKEKKAKESKSKEKEKENATTPRTPRADTIASELDSIQEESYSESFASATISRAKPSRRTDTDIPEDVPDTARTKASQSSIQEDFPYGQSAASITEEINTARSGKRTPDSSEDNTHSTVHEEYTNETFESDAVTTTQTASVTTATAAAAGSKKGSTSTPRLKLGSKGEAGSRSAPKSPKSPLKSPSSRKGSESESEDSFSMVHSETASDQSDVENRIRNLNEDLQRRKSEAEKLKREAKKKQKDRLRQEEHALKKQIEAYDQYIDQVRTEITENVELQERNAVQPKIKKPTQGQKKSPPTIPRLQTDTRRRIDSDGSRSSSSIENGGDSPGQTTPLSPITPGEPEDGKGRSFSESVAESLMSPHVTGSSAKKTSTPDDKSSKSRLPEHSESIEEVPDEVTSMVDIEEGDESEVKLRLDISKTEDAVDRNNKTQGNDSQVITTARSIKSITEDIPTETKTKSVSKVAEKPSKSESKDSKSIKSQYSFEDDSTRSESRKSEKSFTYSTTSRTSYSEEFTEATTGKSSPRRKDPSLSVSKKSQGEPSIVESIDTEEEVSEQLDAESDEEEVVMLDLDTAPVPSPRLELDPLASLNIGDRVLVGGAQPGTLRFKGSVQFASGYFGGIELDKSEGTNNGSKAGVNYFQCKENYGLFAPPEKLEPLPEDWKDDEQSVVESDLSEATLHDEEDVDLEKIAELRRDVTKPKGEAEEKKEGDTIPEDVSVATTVDSELDRVISSAAAAVESFGAEELEARSGGASPVDTTISDSTSFQHQQQSQGLEKVVDKVTDGILHMVVKDSLEAVSDAAQKSRKTVPSDQNASIAEKQVTRETEDSKEEETKDTESNKSQAVEAATQKLLNESISQMLNIYKKKQKSADDTSVLEEESDDNKAKPVTKPSDDETPAVFDSQQEKQRKHTDILILDNDFDPFGSSSSDFGRPEKDDLDQLYDELGALTGDTDEWFDDDFGLGTKKRAPPPYPGTQDKKDKVDSNELKLDLQKMSQEPFFAVPHKIADVQKLTTSAVDVFWQMRRYGEPWESVTSPPSSYFAPEDRSQDIESSNRRAYKQLVFELTGEILMDIYRDEDAEEEEQYSWMPQKRPRQKYHRSREPPTMVDLVEPIVEEQVLSLVGLKSSQKADLIKASKWSSRRKKHDRVDNVLLQELVEEEPDWVDYNEDETTVKMQIADSIFDSLLIETALVFTSIAQKRTV